MGQWPGLTEDRSPEGCGDLSSATQIRHPLGLGPGLRGHCMPGVKGQTSWRARRGAGEGRSVGAAVPGGRAGPGFAPSRKTGLRDGLSRGVRRGPLGMVQSAAFRGPFPRSPAAVASSTPPVRAGSAVSHCEGEAGLWRDRGSS